jgi:HSP20 family protein
MTLVRWSPVGDIMSVRDEMHHLFHEVFGKDSGDGGTGLKDTWTPPVDIYETDNALVLKVELPGVSKDEVSVEIHENTLSLSGERKCESAVKGGHYHRVEGIYGAFQRAFRLPATVDREQVQATYKDGVLELRLPKLEAAKPKGIAITS